MIINMIPKEIPFLLFFLFILLVLLGGLFLMGGVPAGLVLLP